MTGKDIQKTSLREEPSPRSLPTYHPQTDIVDSRDALLITMDMPGVSDKGVDIQLEGSELQISGTFTHKIDDALTCTRREYRNCCYQRNFTLGDAIHRDGIKANMKHGVLELYLPKDREAKSRKIEVHVS